jgi:hypothetical protein
MGLRQSLPVPARARKKVGRPPSDRVRFESRMWPSRIKELEGSAKQDKRAIPEQLDYLLELGLKVRAKVKSSEIRALKEVT